MIHQSPTHSLHGTDMATQADVRRIALALPGAQEGENELAFWVMNKGKAKGFAWPWKERIEPKKARVPNLGVLAIRVTNNAQKDLILSSDSRKFFTEPHYNGYPAVLVRLKEVTAADLRVLLEEGWRCQAPKELLGEGTVTKQAPTKKRATAKTAANGRKQANAKKPSTSAKGTAKRTAGVVLLAATYTLQGCATAGQLSQRDALLYARNDVCGAGAADSLCVVRSVERTGRGYHIVIDRRPPVGQDRVAVDVHAGVFKGRRVEVTQIDTATRRP